MIHFSRAWLACLLLVVVACAPSPASRIQPGAEPEAAAAPKRITVAIRGSPHVFYNKLIQGVPGSDAVEEFVNAGLANLDDRGEVRAQLGERVPTLENGRWQVFPDGRMQLVARMLELLADELPSMPIFYRVEATMISNRLRGVSIATSETSRAWNVQEWDVDR